MNEYISREEVLKIKTFRKGSGPANEWVEGYLDCADDAITEIKQIPAADVAPIRHEHWISFLDGDEIMPERFYKCSRCGRVERRKEPYCHCGAKMDGGAD